MHLDLFDPKPLAAQLETLPEFHRIAFSASICERLLPNYSAFCRIENFGAPAIPRRILNDIWRMVAEEKVDREVIYQYQKDLDKDNFCPHTDDFSGESFDEEARQAISAIDFTLNLFLNPTVKNTVLVALRASDTIYYSMPLLDKSLAEVRWGSSPEIYLDPETDKRKTKEYKAALKQHPFTFRELAKQAEDLRQLQENDRLSPELLAWLRVSSNRNDRSIIDLS